MQELGIPVAPSLRLLAAIVILGCGEDLPDAPSNVGGKVDQGTTVVSHPEGALPLDGQTECTVRQTTDIPIGEVTHVSLCSPVAYATNPPSGGDHWPRWAAFDEFSEPVPQELYVHDLEHGAIALLYNCESTCEPIVEFLREIRNASADPLCMFAPRILISKDLALETPVAAAAWGALYSATCLDAESLKQFVKDHIGNGPEQTCAAGILAGEFPACE